MLLRAAVPTSVCFRLFSITAVALALFFAPVAIAQTGSSAQALEEQNREIFEALKALQAGQTRGAQTAASDAVPVKAEVEAGAAKQRVSTQGNILEPYGFVRIDLIQDGSLPSKSQTPIFVRSPDSPGGGESNFTIHPRLTRLGLRVHGPKLQRLAEAELSGRIEVDFQNGGSESREILRMRHAYIELEGGDWSVLAGQTWDVISPLFPTANNDTLMWNSGNLGDRRPQLRADYHPAVGTGKLSLVGALGLGGAINARDLDGDGVRDGEASAQPNYQGRLGYSHALWGDDTQLAIGVWGHFSRESSSAALSGKKHFDGFSTGVDYDLSLGSQLRVRGEAFFGEDLPEFRGGIGQGVNTITGKEIETRGGWSELSLKVNASETLYAGFSTDDPSNSDLEAGGRTRNRVWWIGNRLKLAPSLLVGLDYLRWTTNFDGLRRGQDNRVNLYFQYNL